MPRSTRKKSKTGIYHVMLRVNTESPVHIHLSSMHYQDVWIEGIGSVITGIYGSFIVGFHGSRTSLKKCVNGNDILYQSEDFSTSVNIVEQSQQSDGTIYDLQGRRINSLPVKGIYIRDGRKYVVK